MIITVTFEVKSKGELVEILQAGSDHSLLDYQIKEFVFNKSLATLKAKAELFDDAIDNITDCIRDMKSCPSPNPFTGTCVLIEAERIVAKAKELQ